MINTTQHTPSPDFSEIKKLADDIGIKKISCFRNLQLSDNERQLYTITALFPYYVANEDGNIAMYARGYDYHTVVRNKLKVIADYIALHNYNAEVYVDTYKAAFTAHTQDTDNSNSQSLFNRNRINDRTSAYKCGLGFIGQNGMLICEEYGSYTFIGQIITDLPLAYTPEYHDSTCHNCGKCISVCPAGLIGSENPDFSKCISYLTQYNTEPNENHKHSTLRELMKASGYIYGCDLCQSVCPYNERLPTTAIEEFKENRITHLSYNDIADLSDKAFRKKYGQYAFAWKGIKPVKRNIVLFNT